jgi:hypothetical protein
VAVALSAETGKPISEEVLRNLKVTWTGKDGNQIEGYHACYLEPSSPEYAPMLEALMQSLEAKMQSSASSELCKRLPKSVAAPAVKSVLQNILIMASHKIGNKGKRPKNRDPKMLKARQEASKMLKDRQAKVQPRLLLAVSAKATATVRVCAQQARPCAQRGAASVSAEPALALFTVWSHCRGDVPPPHPPPHTSTHTHTHAHTHTQLRLRQRMKTLSQRMKTLSQRMKTLSQRMKTLSLR